MLFSSTCRRHSCWRGRGRGNTWPWLLLSSPPRFRSFSLTTAHHLKTTTPPSHPSPHSNSVAVAPTIDVEAIQTRLRQLGVDENTLRCTLGSPKHAPRIRWATVKLALDEGFTARHIAKLLSRGLFLKPDQKFVAALDFLKTLHITGQKAGQILARNVGLATSSVATLERKLELLKSIGLEPHKIRTTVLLAPTILSLNCDSLQRRFAWLQDLGVDKEGILLIVRRRPILLTLDLAKCLLPKIAVLESMGVSRASIIKAIQRRPFCFTLSFDTFAGKLNFIQRLGFEKDSQCFLPVLCYVGPLSSEKVSLRYNALMARGISHDEVSRMVATFPPVLSYGEAAVSKKIDFLIQVMKLDMKQIVRCPAFLSYSLEKRIKPRFKLLADAIEKGKIRTCYKGILGSGLSLPYVMCLSDEKLHKVLLKRERRRQ